MCFWQGLMIKFNFINELIIKFNNTKRVQWWVLFCLWLAHTCISYNVWIHHEKIQKDSIISTSQIHTAHVFYIFNSWFCPSWAAACQISKHTCCTSKCFGKHCKKEQSVWTYHTLFTTGVLRFVQLSTFCLNNIGP